MPRHCLKKKNIETVENLNYQSVSPQIHTEFSNILTYEYLGLPIKIYFNQNKGFIYINDEQENLK